MKLSARALRLIKVKFDKKADGLSLVEFIGTMIQHMDVQSHQEKVRLIADLVDFFHFVDVDGDGN